MGHICICLLLGLSLSFLLVCSFILIPKVESTKQDNAFYFIFFIKDFNYSNKSEYCTN